MPFLCDKSSGAISPVVLGATSENGGTRTHTLTVGGADCLPFQHYEGNGENRPIVAAEVFDYDPVEWNASLRSAWGDVLSSPAAWAKKAVDLGADMIYLKLATIDPDSGNRSLEDCVATVGEVLKAVGCPVAVQGCGIDEYDKPLLAKVAETYKGENLLMGLATQENYATLTAACLANGHTLISSAPLDINICKQVNILIGEMNMPLDRIVIDPSIGGLGYGLEYAYSVMERGRIGALQGDKMLSMPVIGFVGAEAWKAKEAIALTEDFPKWGKQEERGVLWEAITATSLMQSGFDIMVMYHPDAMKAVKEQIDALMQPVNA